METWDAIRSRRDVRRFSDEPVSDAALRRILEAGRRAPSSRNWQPWTFVVVNEADQLRRLAAVCPGARHVATSSAAIALVADDPGSDGIARLHYDLGQVTLQMMLAAADLGIGSGHAVVEDQELAAEVLGLGPHEMCWYLVPLGVPTKPLRPVDEPDRRPYTDVVRYVEARGGG